MMKGLKILQLFFSYGILFGIVLGKQVIVDVDANIKDENGQERDNFNAQRLEAVERKVNGLLNSNKAQLMATAEFVYEQEMNLHRLLKQLMSEYEILNHLSESENNCQVTSKYLPPDNCLWRTFNNTYYYEILFNEHGFLLLQQPDAKEACNKFGGSLLTIRSKEENDFISHWLYDELKLMSKVWLGAERWDNDTANFVWHNTQSKLDEGYTNWYQCEKTMEKTSTDNENCVEMLSHVYTYPIRCDVEAVAGEWNDVHCSDTNNLVVCQTKLDNNNSNDGDKVDSDDTTYHF